MTTYTYNVTATYDDCEIEVKTNSADVAICALMEHAERDVPVMVVDGFTGEIHAMMNCEDPWITEEWNLMILGWLMKTECEIEG